VVLNLMDGGSLTCFREKPQISEKKIHPFARKTSFLLHRRKAPGDSRPHFSGSSLVDFVSDLVHHHDPSREDGHAKENLRFHLGTRIGWIAKDIQSSGSEFLVEVPREGLTGQRKIIDELDEDTDRAAGDKPYYRLYFQCARNSVEKALWLHALERIDRLSHHLHSKRGVQSLFNPNIKVKHRRMRNNLSSQLVREGTALLSQHDSIHEEDPGFKRPLKLVDNRGEKEYLVYPMYAYPNRWMTARELYTEMLKPSETFHDLRMTGTTKKKEIGVLKVEVLECVGLPILDLASETDAVVYLVSGSYAFATDVIWNRLNPKWLPKSRRACVFPIYHAYARLFVGVFDDDGKNEKDDFAGRVVIDLSRLRPRSTYDVTLPLRLSSQVYSRKPRGSVRLRFSLEWFSEREALLSYIPRTIRPTTKNRHEDDVTILCADKKAFRNIATTVHGIHMPGRFSQRRWKASMRELNFVRKVALNTLRDLVFDLVLWTNPVMSGMLFSAWMHCISNGTPVLVPFYVSFFLLLVMMRTYAIYGSDGPMQQGFIPPSFEEMASSLVSRKGAGAIRPIQIDPRKQNEKDGRIASMSSDERNDKNAFTSTHKQQGKLLFWLLGFKSEGESEIDPGFYHMEFPYSQGLRDPITGEICYRRFSVQNSLVVKSNWIGTVLPEADDYECAFDDILVFSRDQSMSTKSSRCLSGDGFLTSGQEKRRRKSSPASFFVASFRSERMGCTKTVMRTDSAMKTEDLPPYLRYPDQDMDSKRTTKKKRLIDGLDELRENVHKMTFRLFRDRTHIPPEGGALPFRSVRGSGKSAMALEVELERLLNIGPFSSSNPVTARIGMYMEPLVDAMQCVLAMTRVVYNVLTWRDPMLSFWVTALFIVSSIVLFLFPWRLFLCVVGLGSFGPQNWILRELNDKNMAPVCVERLLASMKSSNRIDSFKRNRKVKRSVIQKVDDITNQPIISCHTSDNSVPAHLSHGDVDPRSLHQVCVPYSQLNGTQRFYDWPPESQYAKCTSSKQSIHDCVNMNHDKKNR
jgi:hypothetical protein